MAWGRSWDVRRKREPSEGPQEGWRSHHLHLASRKVQKCKFRWWRQNVSSRTVWFWRMATCVLSQRLSWLFRHHAITSDQGCVDMEYASLYVNRLPDPSRKDTAAFATIKVSQADNSSLDARCLLLFRCHMLRTTEIERGSQRKEKCGLHRPVNLVRLRACDRNTPAQSQAQLHLGARVNYEAQGFDLIRFKQQARFLHKRLWASLKPPVSWGSQRRQLKVVAMQEDLLWTDDMKRWNSRQVSLSEVHLRWEQLGLGKLHRAW